MVIVFCGCDLLGIKLEDPTSTSQTSKNTQSTSQKTITTTQTSKQTETTEETTTKRETETTTQTTSNEKTDLVVYYSDSDGYVMPVTISVPKTYQVAAESLNNMVKNSMTLGFAEKFGLIPILPEGTMVKELSITNGMATIDISSDILDYSNMIEENNIFSSIIYVLTGFSSVDSVKITINGDYPGILEYGAVIDRPLSKKDVMLNSNRFLVINDKIKYDVFFVKPLRNREFLVPVSVEFNEIPTNMIPGKMMDVLLKDYTEYDLYSQVPQGTRVIKASIDENSTLEVILSSELVSYGGGSARELALMDQLLHTFAEVDGVKKIKLTIDQHEDILPEGTELTQPFSVSKYINILKAE